MSRIHEGGPAFPLSTSNATLNPGMSLRDYFAGQIIAGFFGDRTIGFYRLEDRQKLAQSAYEVADAMLAERAK